MIPNMLPLMQSIRGLNMWLSTLFCCLFVLLPFSANSQPTKEDWRLVKHKEKISIYTHQSASGYTWVKASMEVKSVPADFLNLLNNPAMASKWIDNCETVEFIAMPSKHQRIVRTTFNAPWPVENRDMVTISTTEIDQQAEEIVIKIRDYSSQYPPRKAYVRIQNVIGKWHIKTISNNKISIEYAGYGEPSGNLPVWLANSLVTSSIYKTFNNLRNILGSDAS